MIRLSQIAAKCLQHPAPHFSDFSTKPTAAVALVLHGDEHRPELLMFQRAIVSHDPWSGHMAFPGGRVENSDASLLETAIRECNEELSLDLNRHSQLLATLQPQQALTKRDDKQPFSVAAFVFYLPEPRSLHPNKEVHKVVSIPLKHFADAANRGQFTITVNSVSHRLPCYEYQQQRIWGLSLRFIDELLDIISR